MQLNATILSTRLKLLEIAGKYFEAMEAEQKKGKSLVEIARDLEAYINSPEVPQE